MTRRVIVHSGTPESAGTALTRDTASDSIMTSPVDLREDDVEAADDRHDVGDHQPLGDLLEDVHRHEGGGAELQPVGIHGPVADEVDPRLPARVLGAEVHLPDGRLERPGNLGHDRAAGDLRDRLDRKSTRLNSSHGYI